MDSLADLLSGAVTIEELAKMEPNVESNIEPNEEPNIEPEMTSETTAEYIVEGEGPEVEVPEVEESIHQQEEPVEEDAMKAQEVAPMSEDKIIEITSMKDTEVDTQNVKEEASVSVEEVSDSTTYISKGTRIEGNLFTDGSVDVIGTVEGDVSCYGKLVVSGLINGKVNASEIYANAAKINGEIVSAGSVKIGVGSVVVGNVEAQSAVVAGAVNGDLDVKGPVIVDSTAVIMGNIKSRSVQINNGAVIEGFCSQCYSDIDVKSFFA
ncbi:MAG: polymer-forming cytoskeletal protein [Lachnospiraceae bacterium]|nr:polymer-forming cytoskeletal protein [Lachnospiraceae bacterium]